MPPATLHHHQHAPTPKPNAKLLSLFLKPIIMMLLTSLFFLFLGFAAFVLLHLCFVGGILHCFRFRFRFRPATDLGAPSIRFATRDVKRLPQFRFLSDSEPESASESQCVVCLDGFRNGQWCRKLVGCGHVFHRRCVDTWLIKVASCPTCRTPVRLNAARALGCSMVGVGTEEESKQFWTDARSNALRIHSYAS